MQPAAASVAGIQIAKLLGARVIATASSDEKLAKAREQVPTKQLLFERRLPSRIKRLTQAVGSMWCSNTRGKQPGRIDSVAKERGAIGDLRRDQRL